MSDSEERRHCEEVARGIAEQHNWHRDSAATKALAQTIARERADARRRALEEAAAKADELRSAGWGDRIAAAIRALASPKP